MILIRDNVDNFHIFQAQRWGLNPEKRRRGNKKWHKLRRSYEENLSKQERWEGRRPIRSGQGVEDKAWVAMGKDYYKRLWKGIDEDEDLKQKLSMPVI